MRVLNPSQIGRVNDALINKIPDKVKRDSLVSEICRKVEAIRGGRDVVDDLHEAMPDDAPIPVCNEKFKQMERVLKKADDLISALDELDPLPKRKMNYHLQYTALPVSRDAFSVHRIPPGSDPSVSLQDSLCLDIDAYRRLIAGLYSATNTAMVNTRLTNKSRKRKIDPECLMIEELRYLLHSFGIEETNNGFQTVFCNVIGIIFNLDNPSFKINQCLRKII